MKNIIPTVSLNEGLKKVGINTIWLISDKLLRMGLGLIIGIWIARYFGPEPFGTWNYSLAFVALFSTIATLGMDEITVRNLALHPDKKSSYLGSTFGMRVISGFISAILCLSFVFIFNNENKLILVLVSILSTVLILQSFDTADLYFQSIVSSYYTVICKGTSFIIISIFKLILLFNTASIVYFALANVLEVLLAAVFLMVALKREKTSFFQWKWDKFLATNMIKNGWPLFLAAMLIMLYLKIDQIMLKEMAGEKSVGLYSAAVRISEIWYFIPVMICSSIFPYVIKQREISKEKYKLTLRRIYSLFVWISLLIAIVISITSPLVIDFLYGPEYKLASIVLSVHIWAGIFVFLGVASSQFLLAENIVKFSLYRTAFGAGSNVILNLLFIPRYHEVGAAYATLTSYFISTFSLVFFKSCREQVFFMLIAIIPNKKLFLNGKN